MDKHLLRQALSTPGATDAARVAELKPDALAMVEAHPWRFQVYHPELEPVLPAVKMFCAEVLSHSKPERWLSLLGPSGIGKTLILRQAFLFLSHNVARWKYKVKSGFRTPRCAHIIPLTDLNDWQAPKVYAGYDLIYIEDIGAGADFEDKKGPGAIMRGRIAELMQLRTETWTLVDSNFTRKEVAQKLDPRIASRFKRDGSRLIEFSADVPDYNDR